MLVVSAKKGVGRRDYISRMVINMVGMMGMEGPTEMVTFEERLSGSKGRRQEDSLGKNILDREKGRYKGLEAGACPICWRHNRKISIEEQNEREKRVAGR